MLKRTAHHPYAEEVLDKKGVFTRDRRPKSVARSLQKRWTELRAATTPDGEQ